MKKLFTSLLALAAIAFSAIAAAAAPAIELSRTLLVGAAEKANDMLFACMVKTGAVLGMAEFNSRQITALAATPKVKAQPYDHGAILLLVGATPAVAAWAQNDTFVIGVIPKGSRILRSSKGWHGAFGASVTMTVGLRAASDGTVIDAAGLLASASVATAGLVKNLDTGPLLNQANGYVCTQDVTVYATFGGAAPTANAVAEYEIHYLTANA